MKLESPSLIELCKKYITKTETAVAIIANQLSQIESMKKEKQRYKNYINKQMEEIESLNKIINENKKDMLEMAYRINKVNYV